VAVAWLAAAALAATAVGCRQVQDRAEVAGDPSTSLLVTAGSSPATGMTSSTAPPDTNPAETTTVPTEPPAAPAVIEPSPPPPPPDIPAPPPPPPPPPPASFADQVRAYLPAGIEALTSGWTLEWHEAREGYLAATYPPPRVIAVYVRPGRSAALTAYDLAHEYGHALDISYLDDNTHRQWGERRGYGAPAWFGCDMCNDFATPAGDWAESVAVCLTGNRGTFRSRLAGLPTGDDCAWIRSVVGSW
jgi:hypothetical protein